MPTPIDPRFRPVLDPELPNRLESAPVVALESTLVVHGLPHPLNLQTAREAENAVREAGAIPATIAVVDGVLRVGLPPLELERLAAPGAARHVLKANRRDLPAAVALRRSAATTVSATLHIARLAGIRIMATGGLGGVHRDWNQRPDLSNDLDELARARGAVVVCSGFKSILDLPATAEILETLGVPLVGYRPENGKLPAFTQRASDETLDHVAETLDDLAEIVRAHRALELPGALVVAQPVPPDRALPDDLARQALDAALHDARNQGVRGKPLTPFLLDRVRHATQGRALEANHALIVQNARLAAQLAVALAQSPRTPFGFGP